MICLAKMANNAFLKVENNLILIKSVYICNLYKYTCYHIAYSQIAAMSAIWEEASWRVFMSEYHKMDTNEYPNIFGCHIIYRMNIQIYSNATYLPNEYPNIFIFRK